MFTWPIEREKTNFGHNSWLMPVRKLLKAALKLMKYSINWLAARSRGRTGRSFMLIIQIMSFILKWLIYFQERAVFQHFRLNGLFKLNSFTADGSDAIWVNETVQYGISAAVWFDGLCQMVRCLCNTQRVFSELNASKKSRAAKSDWDLQKKEPWLIRHLLMKNSILESEWPFLSVLQPTQFTWKLNFSPSPRIAFLFFIRRVSLLFTSAFFVHFFALRFDNCTFKGKP